VTADGLPVLINSNTVMPTYEYSLQKWYELITG